MAHLRSRATLGIVGWILALSQGCLVSFSGGLGARCTSVNDCVTGFCADGVCCASACDEPCMVCSDPSVLGECVVAGVGLDPDGDCGGTPCTDGSTCASGLCVDAVCCDSLCDGECVGCAVPGTEGLCSAEPVGSDPAGDCAESQCNGEGACALQTLAATAIGTGQEVRDFVGGLSVTPAGDVVLGGGLAGQITVGEDFVGSPLNLDPAWFAWTVDGDLEHVRIAGGTGTNAHESRTHDVIAIGENATLSVGELFDELRLNDAVVATNTGPDTEPDAFAVVTEGEGQTLRWSLHIQGAGAQSIKRAGRLSDGRFVLLGSFDRELAVPGRAMQLASGARNAFIVIVGVEGEVEQLLVLDDGTIHVDAMEVRDDVIRLGAMLVEGTTVAGLTAADGGHFVWLELDADLAVVAVHDAATSIAGWVEALATDDMGQVHLLGVAVDDIDVGGDVIVREQAQQRFLVTTDALGNVLRARPMGGMDGSPTSFGPTAALAIDEANNLVVAGTFSRRIEIGPHVMDADGAAGFVVRFGSDGAYQYSRRVASEGDLFIAALMRYRDGYVVAGDYAGAADFGTGQLADPVVGSDLFVLRLRD